MTYAPPISLPVREVVDSLHSPWTLGPIIGSWGGPTVSSAAWPNANQALFVPLDLTDRIVVRRLWWTNGATASVNVDCGIYDGDGVTLLTSTGSTAQAGTSVIQSVSLGSPQMLAAGSYYLALVASATSATFTRATSGGAGRAKALRMMQAGSNFPLASSPTLVAVANDYFPMFGLSQRSDAP